MPKELKNNKITIKSYAKINLFLEIIGKNSNNYHLLQSIICVIDIFDIITFEKSNKLSLNISGKYANFLQNDNSPNIILKTIDFMSRQFNISPNFKISLEKNTPIGAGLGGGSSNGASIILAINELYQLNLNHDINIKVLNILKKILKLIDIKKIQNDLLFILILLTVYKNINCQPINLNINTRYKELLLFNFLKKFKFISL